MTAIGLEDIKRGLRIDNTYSDELIQTYIDSSIAALFVTVGRDLPNNLEFQKLKKTYVQEYVRALFFEKSTERITDALQVQMEAMIKISDKSEEETLD